LQLLIAIKKRRKDANFGKMFRFGMQFLGLSAQRKFVSAGCHAYSSPTNDSNTKARVRCFPFSPVTCLNRFELWRRRMVKTLRDKKAKQPSTHDKLRGPLGRDPRSSGN